MAAELAAGEMEEIPKVIGVLASLLERAAEGNDAAAAAGKGQCCRAEAFRGLTRPAIGVRGYMERIFRYAGCSPSCYVVAYIYLHRFTRRHPSVVVDSFTIHRLLITSVLLAVKFIDDMYFNNAYYAKVGGISTAEMNFLELEFLFGLGFELNVTPPVFDSYCCVLQSQILVESPTPPPNFNCLLIKESEQSSLPQKQQLAAGLDR